MSILSKAEKIAATKVKLRTKPLQLRKYRERRDKRKKKKKAETRKKYLGYKAKRISAYKITDRGQEEYLL